MTIDRFFVRASAVALTLSFAAAAPGCSNDDDPASNGTGTSAVTGEDIVNTDDLLIEDGGAGATKVGDPAVWLEAGRGEIKRANGYVRAGLTNLADFAQSTTPTKTGTTKAGDAFALWTAEKGGVTYTLVVTKTGETRVRYSLVGRKGADRQGILTGVFLKSGPKKGAGRLHIDLGALNGLTGAPEATGRLHVFFANKGEAKARRIRFRDVKPRDIGAEGAINYGLDTLHEPGVGGVLRTYAVGDLGARFADLADLDGTQLAALRIRWTPTGGRADAALFDFSAGAGSTRLGDIHECWDGGGIRKAYKSYTGKENEGDTVDAAPCGGLPQEDGAAAAPVDGVDDPDTTAELGDALSITDTDASAAVDPDAP